MFARNSLLARLDDSAASRAARSTSSDSRITVTSWKAPFTRTALPSRSSGSPMTRTQRRLPLAVMNGTIRSNGVAWVITALNAFAMTSRAPGG